MPHGARGSKVPGSEEPELGGGWPPSGRALDKVFNLWESQLLICRKENNPELKGVPAQWIHQKLTRWEEGQMGLWGAENGRFEPQPDECLPV